MLMTQMLYRLSHLPSRGVERILILPITWCKSSHPDHFEFEDCQLLCEKALVHTGPFPLCDLNHLQLVLTMKEVKKIL